MACSEEQEEEEEEEEEEEVHHMWVKVITHEYVEIIEEKWKNGAPSPILCIMILEYAKQRS